MIKVTASWEYQENGGARDGAVVRALASFLCSERFFPGTPVFPYP